MNKKLKKARLKKGYEDCIRERVMEIPSGHWFKILGLVGAEVSRREREMENDSDWIYSIDDFDSVRHSLRCIATNMQGLECSGEDKK